MDKISTEFYFNKNILEDGVDGELIRLIYDSLPGISVNDCSLIYGYAMARRKETDKLVDADYLTWLWHEMTGEDLRR